MIGICRLLLFGRFRVGFGGFREGRQGRDLSGLWTSGLDLGFLGASAAATVESLEVDCRTFS